MGDVYDLKSKTKLVSALQPPLPVNLDECARFRKEAAAELENLARDLYEGLDIGSGHEQDIFLLKEALLSLTMKAAGVGHPLQQYALDYYNASHGNKGDTTRDPS